jgi:hypothetical protein
MLLSTTLLTGSATGAPPHPRARTVTAGRRWP